LLVFQLVEVTFADLKEMPHLNFVQGGTWSLRSNHFQEVTMLLEVKVNNLGTFQE
jgi:hypothetical protein